MVTHLQVRVLFKHLSDERNRFKREKVCFQWLLNIKHALT